MYPCFKRGVPALIYVVSSILKHNMIKKVQTKPLSAYKELQESDRRLANKLIIALHKKEVDGDSWHLMNRTINCEIRRTQANSIQMVILSVLQGEVC